MERSRSDPGWGCCCSWPADGNARARNTSRAFAAGENQRRRPAAKDRARARNGFKAPATRVGFEAGFRRAGFFRDVFFRAAFFGADFFGADFFAVFFFAAFFFATFFFDAARLRAGFFTTFFLTTFFFLLAIVSIPPGAQDDA